MADSYSVKAKLSAVDSGFSSTLKNAMGLADSFGSKLGGFKFGVFSGMGQKALSLVTSGVSGLIGEIDSSNAAWKTFAGNMEMLGKSGKEITGVKKELQAFAEQSVYSSSDMANTYAQLAAVGTKNTTQLVKGFGGLAAAAENPQQAMKTLSQQATQMAAKPSVAWADFKLMLEQTPAGIAAVAKEMGMTSSELVTAVQEGKVKTDEFFDAITKVGTNKAFSKMATQYKTVGAAMDGLKETIGNKLTPAFDVLSQVGIDALSGLSDMLSGIDAQALADNVSSMVETVGEFLNILKTSFSGVGKSVGDALKALGEAFGITTAEFSKTDAMEAFKSVCDKVAGAIKKVSNFLTENKETIAKVAPLIKGLVTAFLGMKIVNTIAPGLTSFAGSLLKMAGKGIVTLGAKLIGISVGQKAVGTASATSAPSVWQSAAAMLALGASVLMAAVGLALIVQSAIALAQAGWPAVGALVALVAVIALFAIGLVALGPMLTACSVGILAFGAAIALIGLGATLAGAGLVLIATALPALIQYGLQGSVVFAALGAGLAVFSVGALLAGAAMIVLGAGLTLIATALLIAGAAMLLFGAGALLAAGALALISLVLPTLVTYGAQGAIAFVQLGAGLLVFGAGALVAGAAMVLLGAGLLLITTAVLVLAAAVLVLSVGALITAASLAIIAAILPTLAQYGAAGAIAIVQLGAAMLVFAAGAGVAGLAAIVLGAGLAVVSAALVILGAAVLLIGAGILLLGTGALLAAAGMAVFAAVLPVVIANASQGASALAMLSAGLVVFAMGAGVAAIACAALAIAVAATAIAVAAFGIAMAAAAIGVLALGIALKGVQVSMKSIAKNAKSAEKSLDSMKDAVSVVESGLDGLGSMAKSAMKKLTSAFDNSASKAQASGVKVSVGFTTGLQTGLALAPGVAKNAVTVVNIALLSGIATAFSAGANISRGFANGMLSQLGVIQSAAAKMAAAADKAVRAKAKIHSPSKVAEGLGSYWGEGYVGGILNSVKDAWNAAEQLVSVPQVATPKLAMAYGGELGGDYNYSNSSEYVIEVPVVMDGKEVARVTAPYTQAELNRIETRDSRKRGRV